MSQYYGDYGRRDGGFSRGAAAEMPYAHEDRGGAAAAHDAGQMATETINLVREGLEQFNIDNTGGLTGRSVVVLGDTGVGKSTLINLIAGKQLRSVYDDRTGKTFVEANDPLRGFKIGHNLRSETFVPHKFVHDGVMYWDCPGFTDNRGVAQEIANAVCIQKIFETSREVKVLIMIDDDTILNIRVVQLMAFIRLLDQLFLGQIEPIRPSISLVVSQAEGIRTAAHVQTYIDKIIRQLEVTGSQQQLLQSLSANPIAFFRKPNEGEVGDMDTRETRAEIIAYINRIPYASNVRVNIRLSENGKLTAIVSYDILAKQIQENIGQFLKDFKESIESTVYPFSKGSIMDKELRKSGEKRLKAILGKLESVSSLEYNSDNIDAMIKECVEIAKECGKQLAQDRLMESLQKLQLMKYLEQFVDKRAHIPLDIIHDIRERVKESCTTIEKALINITAMNESQRAEGLKKLAEKEKQNAADEIKKREKAEENYKVAEKGRVDAERRHNEWNQTCPYPKECGPGSGGNGITIQFPNCVVS